MEHFAQGLRNRKVAELVTTSFKYLWRTDEKMDIDNMVDYAEQHNATDRPKWERNRERPMHVSNTTVADEGRQPELSGAIYKMQCQMNQIQDEARIAQDDISNNVEQQARLRECFRCGQMGHMAHTCPNIYKVKEEAANREARTQNLEKELSKLRQEMNKLVQRPQLIQHHNQNYNTPVQKESVTSRDGSSSTQSEELKQNFG